MNRREVFAAAIAACVAPRELIAEPLAPGTFSNSIVSAEVLSEEALEAICKKIADSMLHTKEMIAAHILGGSTWAIRTTLGEDGLKSEPISMDKVFVSVERGSSAWVLGGEDLT